MKSILPSLLALVFALSYLQSSAEEPSVHKDGSATFTIKAPNAQNVQIDVQGRTSTANNGKPFDMIKTADGLWTYTSKPLDPGFHYYLLYIDGYRFSDASNPLYFGWQRPTNGVEIPDRDLDFYLEKDVPRGEIHIRPYFSKLTQEWREVRVYTPPQYGTNPDQKFPVLYLQHGSGENETSWNVQGRMGIILDNLLAGEKCKPMIVVMENGYASEPGSKPDASGRMANSFGRLLVEETIPLIEVNYRVKAGKKNRAIAGLSMGSGQALRIALENLDLFSYLGCFSGGGRSLGNLMDDPARINKSLKLFFIGCGTEDGGYEGVKAFHQTLEKDGIHHGFFAKPGTHEWQTWRLHLNVFAPKLFNN